MSKKVKVLIIVLVSIIVLVLSGFGIKSYLDLQEEQEELKDEIKDLKDDKKEEDKEEKKEEKNEEVVDSQKKEEIIEIPQVSGMSVKEATKKLVSAGFVVVESNQESISSDTIEKGKVVKTSPSSGVKREKGTEVVLYVSAGIQKLIVENYVGKDYRVVKAMLEEKGLVVSVEKTDIDNSDNLDDNVIVFQDRFEGEELNPGDKITLMIPNKVQTYPDFTSGYSVEDVQSFCDANGITLKIEFVQDSGYESGVIFYQSRNAGYKVVSGTSLSIKVAK